MKTRGRPRITEVHLKNGFYIEVCDKGLKRGIKIRSENRKAMEDAASLYAEYKDVNILGEYQNGMPLIELAVS